MYIWIIKNKDKFFTVFMSIIILLVHNNFFSYVFYLDLFLTHIRLLSSYLSLNNNKENVNLHLTKILREH